MDSFLIGTNVNNKTIFFKSLGTDFATNCQSQINKSLQFFMIFYRIEPYIFVGNKTLFMKHKLLVTFFFIAIQIGYSQTEKQISGTVFCNDFALQGIEVLNLVSKITTKTDGNGNFIIMAKATDELVFVSQKYFYKSINLKKETIDKTNFIIQLVRKSEELDEVVIKKIKFDKLVYNKYEQESLDKLSLENAQAKVRNPLMNDGTIPNGMDLIRIGGDLIDIIKKIAKIEDKKKQTFEKNDFKEFINKQLKPDFYTQSLHLKPEEVNLFLEFCDTDESSKTFTSKTNVLTLMEFLFAKNEEFKQLPKVMKATVK
jgi:hypothetical protein